MNQPELPSPLYVSTSCDETVKLKVKGFLTPPTAEVSMTEELLEQLSSSTQPTPVHILIFTYVER